MKMKKSKPTLLPQKSTQGQPQGGYGGNSGYGGTVPGLGDPPDPITRMGINRSQQNLNVLTDHPDAQTPDIQSDATKMGDEY